MRVDLKSIWSQWLPAYKLQPTAVRSELLRLGVRYDSSQSLLPVLQLTCLQYVMPVFHHHCTDQLQQKKNIIFNNKRSFYYYLLKKKNPHIITLVILLCVCVKYFFWVFSKSSGPPAIARIMLSAMRLSWRQSSTAPSKFPVSRACVMSPSTSDRRTQMYFITTTSYKWFDSLLLNVMLNHTNKTSSRNVKLLPWLVPRLMPVSAGVGAGVSVGAFGTGAKISVAMDSSWTGVFVSCYTKVKKKNYSYLTFSLSGALWPHTMTPSELKY